MCNRDAMRSEHHNFMFEHFARGDYDGCISHSVKGWIGEIRKSGFLVIHYCWRLRVR